MTKQEFIQVEILCSNYELEISFVRELQGIGLIEIHQSDDKDYLHVEQLTAFEKMLRLHRELNVNPEGIDIILNLLQKKQNLEEELLAMRNRLRLYENDDI
jgi:phage terminase small subunit